MIVDYKLPLNYDSPPSARIRSAWSLIDVLSRSASV